MFKIIRQEEAKSELIKAEIERLASRIDIAINEAAKLGEYKIRFDTSEYSSEAVDAVMDTLRFNKGFALIGQDIIWRNAVEDSQDGSAWDYKSLANTMNNRSLEEIDARIKSAIANAKRTVNVDDLLTSSMVIHEIEEAGYTFNYASGIIEIA